ncbi:BON domain-containing protein [bacterium]|nr:BON domain-containing protein [bacterium]
MGAIKAVRQVGILTIVLAVLISAYRPTALGQAREMSDSRITNAIESRLAVDEAVASHFVDVSTLEGVVTLSGSVSNLLARDRAEDVARGTRGVRSVINRIQVSAADRSDDEIRADILRALAMDPATESYKIEVAVTDALVTLTGSVESWEQKRLAERVARGVRGVREVLNNINVNYLEERSDDQIIEEIRARLRADVYVDARNLKIEAEGGNVTLGGTVGSAAEQARAATNAWVMGVQSVDAEAVEVSWDAQSGMKRVSSPVLPDDEIKQAVLDAFAYDPRVRTYAPTVAVEGGTVTLTGMVGNLEAKWAAGETAENTAGVVQVHNLLRVRPINQPQDDVLEDRVAAAIERDAYLDRKKFTFDARNGKVFLYGVADNRYERQRVEEMAGHVLGVVDVQNSIVLNRSVRIKDDTQLRQDVISHLYWSPYVTSEGIEVQVNNGTVTLTGTAYDFFERRMANENAWQAGAANVRDNLEVRNYDFRSWIW